MQNTSTYIKILKEICAEEGFIFNSYSDNWLIRIDNGEKHMLIHGYKFPNNSASVSELCCDKSSLSEYLTHAGIPCIPHTYLDSSYNFKDCLEMGKTLLDWYGSLVVKPNDGTGGRNVWKVDDLVSLEHRIKNALSESGNVCLSPFVDIQAEYRTIIFRDSSFFTFEKIRPSVIADGETSYFEYLRQVGIKNRQDIADYIPKKGETVLLNWRHNLQGGAKPRLTVADKELQEINQKLYSALGVVFASVDVVKVDGKYYVLEVNSGVMTEHFASENAEYYSLAKNAYRTAIIDYFDKLD